MTELFPEPPASRDRVTWMRLQGWVLVPLSVLEDALDGRAGRLEQVVEAERAALERLDRESEWRKREGWL